MKPVSPLCLARALLAVEVVLCTAAVPLPAAAAAAAATKPTAEMYTLGEGDQRVFLVRHEDLWSMHAENLATDVIVRLWHEAGGPEVTSKTPLDRTYTLSVHSLKPERILERLLSGYSYTLHYDKAGRLERVRVYSPGVSQFKTPRLVENLGHWRDEETSAGTAAAPHPMPAAPPDTAVPADAAPQGAPADSEP